jgi:hypothetical protein
MSKSGGAAAGPTAAAAAAAVQKQKTLLQKADADVSSLVDNFAALINIARVRTPPPLRTPFSLVSYYQTLTPPPPAPLVSGQRPAGAQHAGGLPDGHARLPLGTHLLHDLFLRGGV